MLNYLYIVKKIRRFRIKHNLAKVPNSTRVTGIKTSHDIGDGIVVFKNL